MATRLIQVFLSHRSESPGPGVFEVHSTDDRKLTCTCPGFQVKDNCKHTKLVLDRIERNHGMYPFDFSDKVSAEQIKDAMQSEQKFRELVIHYAKIEVY